MTEEKDGEPRKLKMNGTNMLGRKATKKTIGEANLGNKENGATKVTTGKMKHGNKEKQRHHMTRQVAKARDNAEDQSVNTRTLTRKEIAVTRTLTVTTGDKTLILMGPKGRRKRKPEEVFPPGVISP